MMMYVQSIKPRRGGFIQANPNAYLATSHAEIMERLCEEIHLLAKDSRHFEEQYQMILGYYQGLYRDTKKREF